MNTKKDGNISSSHESYRCVLPLKKNELIGQVQGEKICHNHKTVHVEEKGLKVKKHFLHFMTTFHNFAVKIEIAGAKMPGRLPGKKKNLHFARIGK